MKILITGGCGFLGSNVASRFLSLEEEVVVFDAHFRQGCEKNLAWLKSLAGGHQLTHLRGDTADESAVEHLFTSHGPFDYICHLAGQVAMTTSLSDPRRDVMTNVLGSFNILEAARKHCPATTLAFSSTNKVYGDLRDFSYVETPTRFTIPAHPDGFDETLRLDFASPYGCSKGSADQYFRDWYRNYGLRTVVFRHSSIFGGRQFSTFDQGWIGWFCQKALEQHSEICDGKSVTPFTISGTGKQVRDVLHADDLIALYLTAYEHRERVAGEVFNIGGGIDNSLSLLELFDLLGDLLALPAHSTGLNPPSALRPSPLTFTQLPRRQSDQDFFVADISKASRLLGWKPKVSARDGITRMLDWCRSASNS